MKRYWERYFADPANVAKKKRQQAEWFQEHREEITTRERRTRQRKTLEKKVRILSTIMGGEA